MLLAYPLLIRRPVGRCTEMLYFKNQVTRFVVLFEGRTGSTYLLHSLRQNPMVRAYGERLEGLKSHGSAAQLAWARIALTPPILGRYKAIGLKTKLRPLLDPTGFSTVLQTVHAKVLYMQRRNRVKAAISMIRSRELKENTDCYNLYRTQDRLPASVISIANFDAILRYREDLDQKLQAYIGHIPLPTLQIYYEDLLVNEQLFFANICRFLRVECSAARSRSLKNTSDNLRDVIVNYEELASHYKGTQYDSMFKG